MKCGIVGIPNVGKSSLFNAITNTQNAEVGDYPFCTIEKNVAKCVVYDEKLINLGKAINTKQITYSDISIVDIAGLVEGSSQGKGIGNMFLSHIREVDVILHVIKCFDEHAEPLKNLHIIEQELIFADIAHIEKRLQKKAKNKSQLEQMINMLSSQKYNQQEMREMAKENDVDLLSTKDKLYLLNTNEGEENEYTKSVAHIIQDNYINIPILLAGIENPQNDIEHANSIINKLKQKIFYKMGFISFFTVGEKETKAWKIMKGQNVYEASGKIHEDIQRGFIRAKIYKYDDFMKDTKTNVYETVGKKYIVKDHDIITVMFNV